VLPEQSVVESKRNFFEISVDLDSQLELCCCCRKNLHWDEYVIRGFSTPSQKLSNA